MRLANQRSKETAVRELSSMLYKERLTIEEIRVRMNVSESTAFRYLADIEDRFTLEQDFDEKYFIIHNEVCPLCGSNQQHTTK